LDADMGLNFYVKSQNLILDVASEIIFLGAQGLALAGKLGGKLGKVS